MLGNEAAQSIQHALQITKTLLYVGCGSGLSDPNLRAWLDWTGRVLGSTEKRQYWLVTNTEVAQRQLEHPEKHRLILIPYGARYEDLIPFLKRLQPTTEAPHRTAVGPGASGSPSQAQQRSTPEAPHRTAAGPGAPSCFGRTSEVVLLVRQVLAKEPKPVLVLGDCGIGKSTVTQVMFNHTKVVAHFGEHRFFLRCECIENCESLVAEIARALHLANISNLQSAVAFGLTIKPTLLILDNLETAWQGDIKKVEELLGRLSALPAVALVVSIRGSQSPSTVAWGETIWLKALEQRDARQAFLSIAGSRFPQRPTPGKSAHSG